MLRRMRLGTLDGNLVTQIEDAIRQAIPDGNVQVTGGGGHFSIEVTSSVFSGKNPVQSQRLVYGAIKHLMAGDKAPVHAIDKLTTRVPE
jgi:acid stress-induced BolA-like protein IbaG/YrbA